MWITIGLFLGGITFLLLGGELLVRGATGLAMLMRLSPLFIGLTVVSLGTSAPEMAVSVATAYRGQTDITIGNIVGSNLFNMLMIVGIAALCLPLPVDRQVTRFDVPVMIATCLGMLLLSIGGLISRIDGMVLLIAMIGYFVISFRLGKSSHAAELEINPVVAPEQSKAAVIGRALLQLVFVVAGVGLLVIGCNWFVEACVVIARVLGMSEAVIGLTIVSAGTSLPELVTSVVATFKGERGIAIGNAVGSTTLNILAVLGITAVVAPAGIAVAPEIFRFDMPLMVGAAAISWLLYRTGRRISRGEGLLMVAMYGGYLWMLLRPTAE